MPTASITRWQLGALCVAVGLVLALNYWAPGGFVRFRYPELLLLGLPLWFLYQRWGATSGLTGWLRFSLLVLLWVALAGPEVNLGGRGIDVIVVADRSRSVPLEGQASIRELIQNLERNRRAGNRIAVVTFGAKSEVEHLLSDVDTTGEYAKEVLPDGSDLNEALQKALSLVDDRRPARILVLSDGEANGADPLSAARQARELRVPIDFRAFERQRIGDVAVESILLPESVAPREPFQFSALVYADRAVHGKIEVFRDDTLISRMERDFTRGMNRLFFRDLLDGGGSFNYRVKVEAPNDPLPENNTGAGVLRVEAGPRVLVLTNDGSDGNFCRALRAASIPVDVAVAKEHPLTQDSLDRYRAVIIENVPAEAFGRIKMERLAQFVEDLGGGLMLTGGERSFGTGGYFKSPLDEVLPVSMELREEHRKTRLALAVALDRSGSMALPVHGGKVKMDLANLGTIECVKMLSPSDMVAVIAIDSAPHVISPMGPVDDPEGIIAKVRRIRSEGGGIFVYEALVAAGKELQKAADVSTRHIVLFSDAQDSEEPGDYTTLLSKFESAGITVSVIGLGTPTDVDAKLLEDIAKRGHGNVMFTNDAEELPRLFTQDTMSVARSSFIKKDEKQTEGIPGELQPVDAKLLGEVGKGPFPTVDGYNLSYLRPEARAAVISKDDYAAPWSAFWYRGLGRVAAITFEVDGKNTGKFGTWSEYADFLVTHVRWLIGGGNPNDLFASIRQEGQDAVVTVELDPDRTDKDRAAAPGLIVVPPGVEREAALQPEFSWTGPNSLEARFRMERTGNYRTLLTSGAPGPRPPEGGTTNKKAEPKPSQIVRGPAVTLPYSPEFLPRVGLPSGKDVLTDIARLSGGKPRTDVLEVFHDPPRSARKMPLLPVLCVLGIVLLLLEIAGRRLSLWERLSELATADVSPATALAGAAPAKSRRWWPEWKWAPRRQTGVASAAAAPPPSEPPPPAPAQAPASPAPAADVFAQAKQRARKRL